jgi:oligosaccharide repeat unit polymerase
MLILVSITIVVAMLFVSKARFGTYFSPLSVYCVTWMGVLFLLSLNLLGYKSTSPEAWQLIWLSHVAFILGCISPAMLPRRASTIARRSTSLRSKLGSQQQGLKKFIMAFICLGVLGVLSKWFILLKTLGSFTQIIQNLGTLRLQYVAGDFAFPFWSDLLVFFLFPGMILAGILLSFDRRYWRWVLCLLGLLFLNDMSTASRGTAMHGFLLLGNTYLLSILGSTHILRGKMIRRWLLVFSGAIGLLVILNLMRFIREHPEGIVDFTSFLLDAFKLGYLYLTAPIPAFGKILQQGSLSQGFGAYTFAGLYRAFNLLSGVIGIGKFFPPLPPRPYVFIPQPFNTFPYMWYLYSDFGIGGVLLAPYALGWISAILFLKYRATHRLIPLITLSVIYTYLVMTPRDTMTIWISFWFELAVASCCAIYLERSHKVKHKCQLNRAIQTSEVFRRDFAGKPTG